MSQRDVTLAIEAPEQAKSSTLARASWLRESVLCPAMLIVFYVVVYGSVLIATRGLPYVYDNNESFSAFWHAYNLYWFSFMDSAGVTDESYGTTAEAHPFVHTHQGNFPRLFALVIYALGARTIESQIVVTAFTAGLLTIFTAYAFIAGLTRPLFALLACLVFLTDYLGYAQWHVVTYRVWHMILFFGALLCVQRLGQAWRARWVMLLVVVCLSLFYYELVFAAFTSVTTGLYAAWVFRRRPKQLIATWLVQGLSGVACLAILATQLIAHLGWDVLRDDLALTFFARNSALGPDEQMARLRAFYDTHNIVFFYNIVDVTGFRSVAKFLTLHGELHLQPYTPLFVLLAAILAGGWLVGLATRRRCAAAAGGERAAGGAEISADSALVRGLAAVAVGALGVAMGVLAVTVLRDNAIFGLARANYSFLARTGGAALVPAAIMALAAVALALKLAPDGGVGGGRSVLGRGRFGLGASARTLAAAVFVAAIAALVRNQAALYDHTFEPLWYEALGLWLPRRLSQLVVLGAALLAVACILAGTRRLLGRGRHLDGLVPYLVVALVGYVVAYVLSPGYVWSGYIVRGLTLLVFWTDVCIAVAIWVPLAVGLRLLRASRAGDSEPAADPSGPGFLVAAARAWQRIPAKQPVLGAATIGLSLFAVGYWVHVQAVYIQLLPPTYFSFVKQLGEPPYRGATFATYGYAAPVAAYTGAWAYSSAGMAGMSVRQTEDGFIQLADEGAYLWLADRHTNPEYARPDYYLCSRGQEMTLALARLLGRTTADGGCAKHSVVVQADKDENPILKHKVVARDDSPDNLWAIVKFDWDFPPFLRSLGGAGEPRVKAALTGEGDGRAVAVSYDFEQADGKPEGQSTLRLVLLREDGSQCFVAEQAGGDRISVPKGLGGVVVVTVNPRTATKMGFEYVSGPVVLGPGEPGAAVCLSTRT